MKRQKQETTAQLGSRISSNYFAPLIDFANESLREENWQEALWKAMGDERYSRVAYIVKGKPFEEKMLHADIHSDLIQKLGYSLDFSSGDDVVKKLNESIQEIKPDLATITGQKPNINNVRELQKAVREILDLLVKAGTLGHKQDKWIRFSGREFNFWGFPPEISNLEEHDNVCKIIRNRFGEWSSRTAIVDMDGFHYFEDMGEDASRTLSWILSGLTNMVFNENDKRFLKKCLWCEKFYIHPTKRTRKFCSDICRYDYHNKGIKEAIK